jgi:hypothetical protein
MTIHIERYYGNEGQTPEMECSNDIIDKSYNGWVILSHTSIPNPNGAKWTYFIHAVFRLDSERSIG